MQSTLFLFEEMFAWWALSILEKSCSTPFLTIALPLFDWYWYHFTQRLCLPVPVNNLICLIYLRVYSKAFHWTYFRRTTDR